MKMSDYFPLPLAFPDDVPANKTLVFDTEGDAARAALSAVNHHDALVEALTEIQADANATPSKHAYALCVIRQKAAALLEQIKNDK